MRSRLSPLARLFGAVATLGLVLAGCSSPGEIKDPTPIAGATTFSKLRIGISFDQPGVGTASEAGESDGVTVGKDAKGFDVDTATYVAKALGVPAESITWVKADPVDRENLIEQGKVDMVVSSYTINDARNARVDFAGPYFIAHQDLLVRRNDEELTSVDRLSGRTLCAAANTTSAQNVLNRYQGDVALNGWIKIAGDGAVVLAKPQFGARAGHPARWLRAGPGHARRRPTCRRYSARRAGAAGPPAPWRRRFRDKLRWAARPPACGPAGCLRPTRTRPTPTTGRWRWHCEPVECPAGR